MEVRATWRPVPAGRVRPGDRLRVEPLDDRTVPSTLAANDVYTTVQNAALTVAASGVLANDVDTDGDRLTAALYARPTHGIVVLNPDGSFTYTPDGGFRGTDAFTYRASESDGGSAVAIVTINVWPPSGPPRAKDDAYTVAEDTRLNVQAPGVLANDAPSGDGPLTGQLVRGPEHGTLTFRPDGSFVYTPDPNYFGRDGFTYKAVDGDGRTSRAAHVGITVTPVNDAPVAVPDRFVTDSGVPVTGDVLANDTDMEGDRLRAVLVRGPSHGTLTLNPDGSFTYTPDPGFTGTDSFTYRASDGRAESQVTPVRITVSRPTPPGKPPVVNPGPGPEQPPPAHPPTPTGPAAMPVFADPVGAVSLGPAAFITGPGGPALVSVNVPSPATVPAPPVLPTMPAVPPLPPAGPVETPVRPILIPPPEVAATGPAARALPPAAEDALDTELTELSEQVQSVKTGRVVTDVTIATGVVATAGYVFLAPKLAYWLLSALLARRTVWKPFDPLEVVCAWEDGQAKKRRPDDADDESLQSLVGDEPEARTP